VHKVPSTEKTWKEQALFEMHRGTTRKYHGAVDGPVLNLAGVAPAAGVKTDSTGGKGFSGILHVLGEKFVLKRMKSRGCATKKGKRRNFTTQISTCEQPRGKRLLVAG